MGKPRSCPTRAIAKMRWHDGADMTAAPVGLAAFVITAIALFVAGLGIYALLTAVALGTAAFNIYAGVRRRRERQRDSCKP